MLSRRGFLKKCLAGIAALIAGGSGGCSKKEEPFKENPYEYDVERFKKINPDLIIYKEDTPINVTVTHMKGVSITDDDTIVLTGDKQVFLYTPKGETLQRFSLDEDPYCVSAQTPSELFIGMKEHVEVFDRNGTRKASWISLGETAYITSVCVKGELVVVADYGNKRLWLYNREGKLLTFIDDTFVVPSPCFDVDIDNEGTVWAVNPGRLRLEQYTADGTKKAEWGKASMAIDGFVGCCNPTHVAITADGDVVTAEKGIVRIKKYDRNGVLKGVVAGPDLFKDGTVGLDLDTDSQGGVYVVDNKEKKVRVFKPIKRTK